jgi:hypothetical protein
LQNGSGLLLQRARFAKKFVDCAPLNWFFDHLAHPLRMKTAPSVAVQRGRCIESFDAASLAI